MKVQNSSLFTTYNGNITRQKHKKMMNGDIILEASCQCQCASKTVSPTIHLCCFWCVMSPL